MEYIENNNSNLGVFWRALEWKMLVYFLPFETVYGHLIYFMDLYIHGTICGNLVFLPVLVCCTKQNLATLGISMIENRERDRRT
jgi:hypothetical protein